MSASTEDCSAGSKTRIWCLASVFGRKAEDESSGKAASVASALDEDVKVVLDALSILDRLPGAGPDIRSSSTCTGSALIKVSRVAIPPTTLSSEDPKRLVRPDVVRDSIPCFDSSDSLLITRASIDLILPGFDFGDG